MKSGKAKGAVQKEESKAKEPTKKNFGHDYKLQPKKAQGPYIIYNTAETARLKEEEGLSHGEAFAKAGAAWNSMTEDQKKKYVDLNDKDVKRYEKQVAELEKKGYFTTEDGQKSTDLPVDPKKKWGKDVVMPKGAKNGYNCF